MNLMMLLEMAATGAGERVAFKNGKESLSYQALFGAAGSAARLVRESGQQHLAFLDGSWLWTFIWRFVKSKTYLHPAWWLTNMDIDQC